MAMHTIIMPGVRRAAPAIGCQLADDHGQARLSRRALLDGVGFTALAGVAAVALATPDVTLQRRGARGSASGLIGLARAYAAKAAELRAVIHRHGMRYGPALPAGATVEQGLLLDQQRALADEMVDLVATTPAELAAKASVIRDQLGYTSDPEPEDALIWSLLSDLQRSAAA